METAMRQARGRMFRDAQTRRWDGGVWGKASNKLDATASLGGGWDGGGLVGGDFWRWGAGLDAHRERSG